MSTPTTVQERPLARPLKVLVPLIQDDLAGAKDAAERAALPYYQAAGEKLLEAKQQLKHGEFTPWVEKTFHVSARQCRKYMALAEATAKQNGTAVLFSTLNEFIRSKTIPDEERQERKVKRAEDEAEWRKLAELSRQAAEATRAEEAHLFKLQVESDALTTASAILAGDQRCRTVKEMVLQIIAVGFSALARKHHPDTGGNSSEQFELVMKAKDVLDVLVRRA
jgi:Protein of unknown function (DUF3102)